MNIEIFNNYKCLVRYLDSQMTYKNTSIIYRLNYQKLYIPYIIVLYNSFVLSNLSYGIDQIRINKLRNK